MKRLPKYMVRTSDGTDFILGENDKYMLLWSWLKWPEHLHWDYSYEVLRSHGFEPDWSRED